MRDPGGESITGMEDVTSPNAPPRIIIARQRTTIDNMPLVAESSRKASPPALNMYTPVTSTWLVRTTR